MMVSPPVRRLDPLRTAAGALVAGAPSVRLIVMDRSEPPTNAAFDEDWEVREGEEVSWFALAEEDPEFAAWLESELLETIAQVDAGTMPLIDNEEVRRKSIARQQRFLELAAAEPTDP